MPNPPALLIATHLPPGRSPQFLAAVPPDTHTPLSAALGTGHHLSHVIRTLSEHAPPTPQLRALRSMLRAPMTADDIRAAIHQHLSGTQARHLLSALEQASFTCELLGSNHLVAAYAERALSCMHPQGPAAAGLPAHAQPGISALATARSENGTLQARCLLWKTDQQHWVREHPYGSRPAAQALTALLNAGGILPATPHDTVTITVAAPAVIGPMDTFNRVRTTELNGQMLRVTLGHHQQPGTLLGPYGTSSEHIHTNETKRTTPTGESSHHGNP